MYLVFGNMFRDSFLSYGKRCLRLGLSVLKSLELRCLLLRAFQGNFEPRPPRSNIGLSRVCTAGSKITARSDSVSVTCGTMGFRQIRFRFRLAGSAV